MNINYSEMKGQALVESIVIIPIFFLLLSGVIILFQIKLRIMVDENVLSGQMLSFAYLSDEEKWSAINSEEIVSQQIFYSFMPSKFFRNSVDQIDGLFFDKVYLSKNESALENGNNPQYGILNSLKGVVLLETWAHDSNYEREKNLPFNIESGSNHKIYEEKKYFLSFF